ncbi:hypothetical protein SERLA73DRAFT_47956, partial [Serpula lacrymans var. lacrymans S7.3]
NVTLDEAHCISEWGNTFQPDYSKIGHLHWILPLYRTISLCFSDYASSHPQRCEI